MTMTRLLLRTALATAALLVIQMLLGGLVARGLPPPPAGGTAFVLLSDALTAAMLVLLASRMERGRSRVMALAAVGATIPANNLLEAVFFSLDIPRHDLPAIVAMAVLVPILVAPVVDALAGKGPDRPPAWPEGRPLRTWLGLLLACDAVYVAAYFSAGALVWPFVQAFYSSRSLPETPALLSMQLVRGLVFAGVLLLLAARLRARRTTAAVLAGLTMAILGGVAPLLVPNPYMPAAIRWPHLVETGVSNLLFGIIGILILTVRSGDTEEARLSLPAV